VVAMENANMAIYEIESALKVHLTHIDACLKDASAVAAAAVACAVSGNFGKAIEIVLDIEQPLYEANVLLNAASLIHRLSKS
jgi:hypothetical protein